MGRPKQKTERRYTLLESRPAEGLGESLAKRQTPEIVIGLVGPVASGVSTVSKLVEQRISSHYGYDARVLKLSDLIRDNKDIAGDAADVPTSGPARIKRLQEIGTKLRQGFGSGYLAAKAIEKIAVERTEGGYLDDDLREPARRRVVHIVDSIKNPEEAHILRLVYGSAFWLIGVFAARSLRIRRLKEAIGDEASAIGIIDTDEHEGPEHGQDVRAAFYESDYFLKNPYSSTDKLKPAVDRMLKAIFEDEIVTPNEDERGMAAAKQSAAASSCLSRQVGAVIIAPDGNQIGSGWNEVPKFGGGVYTPGTTGNDGRCFSYKSKNCRNDQEKARLLQEVVDAVKEHLTPGTEPGLLLKSLSKTGIRSLIEFSRSVHAEMAAIVDVARSGGSSVANATMYVTTFPCHSCARHIIAAGIRRVVYIEPYPKSLAIELHDDAVTDASREHTAGPINRVVIEPFEGVGPQRYLPVFLMRGARKGAGVLLPRIATQVLPADAESLDAFTTLEKRVLDYIKDVEKQDNGGANG